jgi:hypothetical protein
MHNDAAYEVRRSLSETDAQLLYVLPLLILWNSPTDLQTDC